jgi:hypothetical protein
MNLSWWQYALWLLQPALQASIAWAMYRRKIHQRFPIFFTYTLFHVLDVVLLYSALHRSYATYFYTYWWTQPAIVALHFAIIYECFLSMFKNKVGLKDFGSVLFRWSAVMMVLMGLVVAFSDNGQKYPLMAFIFSIERAAQVMLVGLFLFVLFFTKHLGIDRHNKIYGLTLGLGLFAAVDLLLYTEVARSLLSYRMFNTLHVLTYDIAAVIWLAYMLSPEPADILPNMLLRSQRWNEQLLEQPDTEEATLLLGIESIVDRAMNGVSEKTTNKH